MLEDRKIIINVCEQLAETEDLKVTFRYAAKDAIMVTLGALLGGLLWGPIGLAIGGSLMAVTRAIIHKGKYKSVVSILRHDLTSAQQTKLAEGVHNAIRNITSGDMFQLVPLILNIAILKEAVLREIHIFMSNELKVNPIP